MVPAVDYLDFDEPYSIKCFVDSLKMRQIKTYRDNAKYAVFEYTQI